MDWLFASPIRLPLALVLAVLAVVVNVQGWRTFLLGIRDPDHPDQSRRVILGFRNWILSLSLIAFAGGLWARETWPLILGVVFLAEELLETGTMLKAQGFRKRPRTS